MKWQLVAVSGVTLVAQLAGYVKLWLMARLFGVSPELDGYYLGFVLPTVLAGALSGILQIGVVPLHAELRMNGTEADVRRFERLILLGVACTCAVTSFLLVVGADFLVPFLASDSTAAVRNALRFVLPIAALAVFLNAIGDYFSYLLAIYNRYVVACSATVANTLVGALLLAAWPEGGLTNLTVGTILGSAVQTAICLVAAMRHGFRPFGPMPSKQDALATAHEMSKISAWTLPGVVFSNLTVSIPPVMVAVHGDGAVAAFGYAYRLHTAAVLLVSAGLPVVLARFASLRAQGETAAVQRLLHRAGWLSALLGLVAIPVVWLFGARIVELLLASGRFDATAVARTAEHWIWLTLGLGFYVWGNIISKYLQADKRPAVLTVHAALVFLAFLSISKLLAFMGEYSVSAAFSLTAVLYAILLHVFAQFGLTRDASKHPPGKFYP